MTIKIEFPLLLGDKDKGKIRWNYGGRSRWMLLLGVVFLLLTHECEAQYTSCELMQGTYTACTPTPTSITRVFDVKIAVEPSDKTCGLAKTEYYFRLGKVYI